MNSILSKQQIDRKTIHAINESEDLLPEIYQIKSSSDLISILKKLNKSASDKNQQSLIKLLDHSNLKIRLLALKNLAKLSNPDLLPIFIHLTQKDKSSQIKQTAVTALGKLKNEQAIPTLISFLDHEDPKIVLQAIRGLLPFKHQDNVQPHLAKLIDCDNELIREYVSKNINNDRKSMTENQPHDISPPYLRNIVIQGDVVKIIKHIPNESIHLTFTSPPYYNARDYSIYKSYPQYLSFLQSVFEQLHRITKPGRFFILNTSPVIMPRISRSHSSTRYPIPYDLHPLLTQMGWEFIDDIVWVKPSASVKNRNGGFLQHRKPLGYKPNAVTEMLMVYRKKTDKLIDWNMQQYSQEKTKASQILDSYESTNVWHIDPVHNKTHSAVFPKALCERVIKYYSFVEDLIFDPFAGSGTTGLVAQKLNRYFILIEKLPRYVNYIRSSLDKPSFFDQKKSRVKFFNLMDFKNLSNKRK